jgi:hypothetical protein
MATPVIFSNFSAGSFFHGAGEREVQASRKVLTFFALLTALIHVLLLLDINTTRGSAVAESVHAELSSAIDSGLGDYERTITLLEQFKRLYLLSRLFQSRNHSAKVLEVWRRTINGEEDTGGEINNVEEELRTYLLNLQDMQLVEEYGI